MANVAELVVKIVTDTKGATSDLDATASKVTKFQSGIQKAALPAAAALLGIGAAAVKAGKSASELQQSFGAVESVFGDNAETVKNWAKDAAKNVGLATSDYANMASVIGAQLKNMGVPLDKVAGKTNDLITLGADLSATYGGTTAEAVQALGSALRGETDPIERYGVSIKQADILARQAAEGTDQLEGAAGKTAKTQALLGLVAEQTADAQGQFARESDSAAGAQQIAQAQFENTSAALGTALLPLMTALASMLGTVAEFVGKNSKAFQILVVVIAAVAAAVLAINAALKIYQATMLVVQVVQKATWLGALGPIALVIAAVVAVIAIIVVLWNKSETFRAIVLGVWNAIRNAAQATGNAIEGAFRGALDFVRGAFASTRDVLAGIMGGIRGAWDAMVSAIRGAMAGLAAVLRAPFDAVKGAIDAAIDAVHDLIGWLGNIKVPSINLPGPFGFGASTGVAATAALAPARTLAPGVAAPRTAGAGGVTINVTGAIDPEATARQIQRILSGHTLRMGR